MNHSTCQGILPNQIYNTGYQYDVTFDTVNVFINNISGNSANILSKPFIVTIIYEA